MKILSLAPTRISLFGGGTDVAPYSQLYGGVVVNIAINIRQKMILYSDDEMLEAGVNNEFPIGADPSFCYKILEEYKINGLHHSRIKSYFDGVIGAGIGSSGAAAVTLIGAINKRKRLNLSKEQIALEAWRIETEVMGKYGGKQDQLAAVYGGVNQMYIGKDIFVSPIRSSNLDKIISSLVLFYSGLKREKKEIQKNFLNLTDDKKIALDRLKELALMSVEYIKLGDVGKVAELMKKGWLLKKMSNPDVETVRINELYDIGMAEEALAGKILGAGSGGYIVFICDPAKKEKFISRMKKYGLENEDFSVCYNGLETKIL